MTQTRFTPGRIAAIVAGSLAALLAAGLIVAGGVGFWANGERDDDGYISTAGHRYTADTAALTSEEMDIDLDGAGWLVDDAGRLKLEVTPRTGEDVFVGVARTSDVDDLLDGVARTTVTDVDFAPFDASYRRDDGASRATPPASAPIWAAAAQGSGTQKLRWKVTEGSWSIVVMNRDGSPGVDAEIASGVKIPHLAAIAWTAFGSGLLLLAAAIALFYAGLRRPRSGGPTAPAPVTSAAFPAAP